MAKVTHLTLAQNGELASRRVHFRDADVAAEEPLETIGQDLRAARVRRGDDLATVSRVLKIRKDHLEALEEDRLGALPGRTYAVGFVRAYSQYVGLNPLEAVERFKAEIAGRDETSKTAGFPEVVEDSRPPYGWIAIGVLIVGIIAYGGYYLVTSSEPLVKQPVGPVPARILAKPAASTAAARAPARPTSGSTMGAAPQGGSVARPASAAPQS